MRMGALRQKEAFKIASDYQLATKNIELGP